MTEELDEVLAEETAPESSAEEQTPESEDSAKEEGKVPVARLKRETAKRKEAEERAKAAQELFAAYVEMEKEKPSVGQNMTQEESAQFNTKEDWLKYIDQKTKAEANIAAKAAEERARESIRREAERRELERMDDFPILKDLMVEEVKRNPSLSPLDAYYLSKAKNPILLEKQIEEEVSQDMDAKQKAQVGKSAARKEIPTLDPNIFTAKDGKGNFKMSLKDLKEMLTGK